MINWRSIKEDGLPDDPNIDYLVSDGKDIAVSSVKMNVYYSDPMRTQFKGWGGCDFTYEDNQCCSGDRVFDMEVTHWCPANEVNLPK